MQAFTLDHASAIPVKLQLKAQVKYQLLAGLLRPGDQLPPLRDLAAGLGVHLNTVVRAFAELEAEGFLHSHHGRGVFVPEEFPQQGQGAALRSLLAGMLQGARDFGLTPEEMAMATLAFGQLARPPQAPSNRLLLVGGSRADLRRLTSQLEAALPALVVPVLAEELTERVRPREFPIAACTLFHEADVRRHLPDLPLAVLAPEADRAALLGLQDLSAGARVDVAGRDWLQAARIRRSLELSGLEALQFHMAVAGDTSSVTFGSRTIFESRNVPPEALALLRQGLAAPATAQTVHVRSAWI
ncbi:MAG TPA: GntR family transcriptional regulator [Symbiobacteriaceae bacterium]|nr:GntR family transcriptional regulator [Symbiobacteriaceae bacterium]